MATLRLGTLLLLTSLLSISSVAHRECIIISLGSNTCNKSLNGCYKSFDDMLNTTDYESAFTFPPTRINGSRCYRLEVHGVHSITGVWHVSGMDTLSIIGMNNGTKVTIKCSNEGGIVLEDIVSIVLDNIQFINCGHSQVNDQQPGEAARAAVTVKGSRPATINVTNCSFVNKYNEHTGGGIMIDLSENGGHHRIVYLIDCLFESNRATIGGGAHMNVTGDVLLLIENCQFIDNRAELAGGGGYISIHRATKNTLLKINNSLFINNTAGLTGGGIFVNASHHPNLLNMIMTQVTFANNSAPCVQDLAYEDAADHALISSSYTISHSSIIRSKVIPYHRPQYNQTELCIHSNLTCCGISEVCNISLMLGERMYLSLTEALPSQQSSSINDSYAVVKILPSEYEHCYTLVGMNIIRINRSMTVELQQVPFYIALTDTSCQYKENDTVTLKITSIGVPDSWFFLIKVTLKDCMFGYQLTTNSTYCQCAESDDVACDDHTYTACVRFGHWFGKIHSDGNYTVTECPFGSCNYAVSNECPAGTTDCYINDKPYPFFCALNRSDDVCLYNKGDAMCSKCQDGYHPSFPDMKCIPKRNCNDWYALLQTCLYAVYLIVAVLFVLAAVKFDFRIESGQVYCLVFYFSVFEYFIGGVFPSQTLYVVNIIISGVLQFNPAILGMLPLCTKFRISRFNVFAIQLCNPIVLALAILTIVLVSKKYQIWQNTRHGINALCIMLYLCFISITQTTLMLLHPIKLSPVHGVYTFLDPTEHYFGPHHWPYGVISLLLQLMLVLPFLCLLLFSPFLVRFRRLNLTRIKPILDEFQACYKTEYRYFAGFYLTCRQLIFLMSFVSLGNFGYIYVLQILSIFILATHYCVQPYKSKALNVIDGLLILDLVLLSILHGNTAQVVFKNRIALKETLVYVLVLLPVVYFVLLCLNPFIQRYAIPLIKKSKYFPIDKFDKYAQQPPLVVPPTRSVVGLNRSNDYSEPNRKTVTEREPLLFTRSK